MLEGRNLVAPVPLERWDLAALRAPSEVLDSNMLRFAAFAADVAAFDAGLFRLSRSEAAAMDPQARLLLHQVAAAQQVRGSRCELSSNAHLPCEDPQALDSRVNSL